MVHYWLTWRHISVWSYVTVLLQGLSLTADYSLRYLGELHWINYPPAELWHFLGLYDRWQPHPPSISLSPFSPLPLLIQNLSFAKGKGRKSTRTIQKVSPGKHFEGYLILTRGGLRESSSLGEWASFWQVLCKQGDKYLWHLWTGRGLVVFTLIPAPAITLSASWQGCQLPRWTARMEGEFRNWMAIKFQHNIQQWDNIFLGCRAITLLSVDGAMMIVIMQMKTLRKEKAGILNVVFFMAKPLQQTHRPFHCNDKTFSLHKQAFPQKK